MSQEIFRVTYSYLMFTTTVLHKLNKNHHNKPKDNKDDLDTTDVVIHIPFIVNNLQKTILFLLPFFLKNFKENNI